MDLRTFKFFNSYGWSWSTGKPKKWGNTDRFGWLAKILHILNGDKSVIILNDKKVKK